MDTRKRRHADRSTLLFPSRRHPIHRLTAMNIQLLQSVQILLDHIHERLVIWKGLQWQRLLTPILQLLRLSRRGSRRRRDTRKRNELLMLLLDPLHIGRHRNIAHGARGVKGGKNDPPCLEGCLAHVHSIAELLVKGPVKLVR